MSAKKISVWTVPVYGELYAHIFLDYQLRSFLDETNIPAVKDRIHFHIFTDPETRPRIEAHPNYQRLKATCSTGFGAINFPPSTNKFGTRYTTLINVFRASVSIALEKDAYLSPIVCDLVCAKGFLPKVLAKMDEGHGAVFMLPLRSCFESMIQHLERAKPNEALDADSLFKAGYENLHPLWWACHWDNPLFTKLPFSLLWNSGTGVLAKSFSVTPIIFIPTVHMSSANRVIDVSIPSMCQNVYWADDWVDAPIIGCEPIICYYPTFSNRPSSIDLVGNWAYKALHSTQFEWLRHSLYYPSKAVFNNEEVQKRADEVASKIYDKYGGIVS